MITRAHTVWLIALLALALPHSAYALVLGTCAPGVAPGYVTTRMVTCIQTSILNALQGYIAAYTQALGPTIMVLFTLGVILYAIKLLYQPRELQQMTFGFMLRFVIAGALAWHAATIVLWPFMIITDLTRIVAGGYTPWVQMDALIGRLLGFNNAGASLSNGLIGVIGAMLFSGLSGILAFLLGMISVIFTLYFVFRAVFIYLSAIIMVAFLMVISPLIIPLALFPYLDRSYVKKWTDLLIASMITPVVMVAFLSMFLSVIGIMINLSINSIHGNAQCSRAAVISGTCAPSTNFSAYTRSNTNLTSWLLPADPYTWNRMAQNLGSPIPGQNQPRDSTPPVQSFMSPSLLASMDANPMATSSLDFGPDQVFTMQMLTLNFLGLFIVVYLMKGMMDVVPELADSLGGVATGLGEQGVPLLDSLKQSVNQLKKMTGGGT